MDKIKKALEQARNKREKAPSLTRESQVQVLSETITTTEYLPDTVFPTFEPNPRLLEKHRILQTASPQELAKPFKVLRTRLNQLMQANDWSVIAVMSPTKDDGKTTVAINLAMSIAQGVHNSAVLLDLDMMNPSVHKYLGYDVKQGLNDYYNGRVSLREVLVSPGLENLLLAPTSQKMEDSSECLASPRSNALISELKQINQNSKIIIDLPPLLSSDDAIAFCPFVDAVLLVVREGKTKKEDIQRSIELLDNTKIAGVILNDVQGVADYGYY